MSRWALIPVKSFDRGKSRLAEVLPPNERAAFSRKLFEHVVRVLQKSASIDGVAIVSDSTEAREQAEHLGAVALEDVEGSQGLAEVVDAALNDLEARGATSVLVCMSDLPELSTDDIESVGRLLDEVDVVLVPDLLQEGTNVVALKPPSVLPSCLGHEDSLQRHRDLARDLGLTVSVQLRNGISFDVDRPGDLARLRRS
ncbi:MAG: 2-phospho-L-lactate guanylyltransferase [Polyangiales bacterium]|jgi:2-phospho-L-lactate guanylyltransferase